uniref:Exonuclease domain-containing protein n=1 Tax=Sarcophilus harrisii TaxID=9305 RepID=A0A7N4PG46_SARHA
MEIESTFHMYVQPAVHPQLTPFCTELTGIIQGMVDGQPNLQQVLERVDEWMGEGGQGAGDGAESDRRLLLLPSSHSAPLLGAGGGQGAQQPACPFCFCLDT